MKCDCHCAFGPGYDKIMSENCKENWVLTPILYNIDYATWKRIMNPSWLYYYIGFPVVTHRHGTMLPVLNWPEREKARQDPKYDIDDTMSIIGGCWFVSRKYFLKHVGVLDDSPDTYGPMVEENHEINLKYWLGGGKAKIIKKTWFAHFAKRPHMAHVYQSKYDDKIGAPNRTWACRHWVNNEEPGMVHPFSWLIEKFWPVPTWPEDRSKWVFPENTEYSMTELCKLGIKYGSYKCPQVGHSYTPFYYELLKDKRESVKKVLEIGDPGHSNADLRMWKDFFPNAVVFGASLTPNQSTSEEKIAVYHCDERDLEDIKNLISLIGSDIDLVIDNADNHIRSQAFLFQNLMPMLESGATYVIENCSHGRLMRKTFPEYNCSIPGLLPNRASMRDGLLVFTYKNI